MLQRCTWTKNGSVGNLTIVGNIPVGLIPWIALPSWHALGRFVSVRNPANNRAALAMVLDVGPWNDTDEAYVFAGHSPAAIGAAGTPQKGTDGAGMLIGDEVCRRLELQPGQEVEWEFVD